MKPQAQRLEHGALNWVKKELDAVLTQARQALETYIENEGDKAQLVEVKNYLHQVNGTLHMVELYGAAMLAQEMEDLTQALINGQIRSKDDAFEVLLRAILQLPDYLEHIQHGNQDVPIVLLPLLNDLRTARDASLLSEKILYFPALKGVPVPERKADAAMGRENSQALAKRLRHTYQLGLLAWFRDQDQVESLRKLQAVTIRLYRASVNDDARRLWWLASAVTEALALKGLESSVTVKSLLGKIDREIKLLIDNGEDEFAAAIPDELAKNLLYYIASAENKGSLIRAIKHAYGLDEMLPTGLTEVREMLGGPNLELWNTVASAIHEDLADVKDKLEIFLSGGDRDVEKLDAFTSKLKAIADTLGMLGLGNSRRRVLEEAEFVRGIIDGKGDATDTAMMSMAEVILDVESSFNNFISTRAAAIETEDVEAAEPPDEDEPRLPDAEYRKLLNSVVSEVLVDMERSKEAIMAFIASPEDSAALKDVPEHLKRISGTMAVARVDSVLPLINSIHRYISERVLAGGAVPEFEQLESLAEAITSMEYFLESLTSHAIDPQPILEHGHASVAKLGYPVDGSVDGEETIAPPETMHDEGQAAAPVSPSQPQSLQGQPMFRDRDYQPLAGEVDEEMLEIFLEEAQEETDNLKRYLSIWERDTGDRSTLTTMRRSFHTLKGSGRMVGAQLMGEFAWAFENLLNRVNDRTIGISDDLLTIISKAVEALPQLIDQINTGREPEADVWALMEQAHAMTKPGYAAAPIAPAKPEAMPTEEAAVASVDDTESTLDVAASKEEDSVEITDAAAVDDLASGIEIDLEELHDEAAEPSEPVSAEEVREAQESYVAESEETEPEPQPGETAAGLPPIEAEAESSAASEAAEAEEKIPAAAPELVEALVPSMAGEGISAEEEEMPATAEEQDRPARDPVLMEIFTNEARQHLATLEFLLKRARTYDSDLPVDMELTRALHTLNGSARTAEIEEIADLCGPLELYAGAKAEVGKPIPKAVIAVMDAAAAHVRQVLDTLRDINAALPANIPLEEQIQFLLGEELAAQAVTGEGAAQSPDSTEPAATEEPDSELVNIFLEEAADILDASDHALQQWSTNPENKTPVAELQRQLHTLKGGARMAGASAIGDLSHALESLFDAIAGGAIGAGPTVFDLLHRAFDRLHAMLESTTKGQRADPAPDLIARLDQMRTGEPLAEAAEAAPDTTLAIPAAQERSAAEPAAPLAAQEVVRVRSDLLDNLVNYAGEVSIYHARLEQQIATYGYNLNEFEQTVTRLRGQLRKLELETEAQILFRYEQEREEHDKNFDPLEMDRYSTMQQLSRALAESVNDLVSIKEILLDLTRGSETLLLQQSRVSTELQEGLMRTRLVQFAGLAPRLRRIARQTADELGKRIELKIAGGSELDRTVLERMTAPLEHLLRNAIAHGIEPPETRATKGKPEIGKVRIDVAREGSEVVITVADDGAGVDLEAVRDKAIRQGLIDENNTLADHEILQLIMEPGFTTAEAITQIAGRGVGLDVVDSEVKQLGGALYINSTRGQGTQFIVRLPFTLAINQALLVHVGEEELFAVPLPSIEAIVRLEVKELQEYYAGSRPIIEYAANEYEVKHLGALLGLCQPALDEAQANYPVLLVRSGDHRVALQVEDLLGSREIVVKSVGPQISKVRGISGATILGDGRVVLILDTAGLSRLGAGAQLVYTAEAPRPTEELKKTAAIMVVDDSITIRKITSRMLERNSYTVLTAKDGVDAVALLQENIPDLMLLDIEMPRMDGYELAIHMRNNEQLKDIPIIMITSRTGEKHRQRAHGIGVNQYLGKPYQETELLDNIRQLLQAQGKH